MTTTASDVRRADAPPREQVLRTAPFELRADDGADDPGDGRTLDGYGAVFNRKTLIDSWEGRFWETITPGCQTRNRG